MITAIRQFLRRSNQPRHRDVLLALLADAQRQRVELEFQLESFGSENFLGDPSHQLYLVDERIQALRAELANAPIPTQPARGVTYGTGFDDYRTVFRVKGKSNDFAVHYLDDNGIRRIVTSRKWFWWMRITNSVPLKTEK